MEKRLASALRSGQRQDGQERKRDEAKRQSERNIDPDIRLSVPQSRLGHHGEDDHHGERRRTGCRPYGPSTSTSDASEAAPCPIRIECSGLVRRKRSARWLAVAVATSMEPNDRMPECSHSAGRDKQAAQRAAACSHSKRHGGDIVPHAHARMTCAQLYIRTHIHIDTQHCAVV